MRRKRVRATCSFRAIIRTDGTTTLWTCIVYLFFIAICTCNDDAIGTANLNTTTTINRSSSSSSSSGHYVESTTPVYSTVVFTNNSTKDVTESNIFHADSAANLSSQPTTANQERKRTFLPSGNELWDGLIDDCLYKPSFSCFQKNVYTYLDNTLKLENVNVTERIQFRKIDIDPDLLVQLQHSDDEDEMEEDGDNEISKEKNRDFKSESPIEEVTDALYGKWRNFMMTHNVELKMPEMVFDGATFRVTPRGFEGDGAIVKLEMIPNQQALEVRSTGRLFLFKKISKLLKKKFFKNKLLLSFLAIVLVIKLIKIKIFWILPLIVGVTAAKKLLLKFILFLFPALSHLFKLCSYYHKNYHDTKYHHHRHQINHLHTVVPAWYNQPHSIPQPHSRPPIHSHPPHGADVIYTSPPKGHPAEYIHGLPNPTHQHYPNSWEHSGPGLGSEYISDVHRNINVNSFKPELESDDSTINSWGLQQPAPSKQPDEFYPNSLHSSMSPSYPDQENSIGRTPVSDSYSAQSNIYGTYETSSQMKYNAPVDKYLIAEKIQNAIRRQPAYAPQVQSIIAADPFYGPIVGRIDSILNQYSAYVEENCKEWLVCNMYKSPAQFSPHSNFLSAELSRDSSELQKPTALNAAVLTFYKYVKAARDGQDQKDCLSINPKCVI